MGKDTLISPADRRMSVQSYLSRLGAALSPTTSGLPTNIFLFLGEEMALSEQGTNYDEALNKEAGKCSQESDLNPRFDPTKVS